MAIYDDKKSNPVTRNRLERLGGEQTDLGIFFAALAIALMVSVFIIAELTRDTANTTTSSGPVSTNLPSTGANAPSNQQRPPKQP
jgi:hypothetical protein